MKIRERVMHGVKLSDLPQKPVAGIADISMAVNEEGTVLLKNSGMLPLKKGDKVAVFGRIQFHYYKSGTGSGGMVNTEYTTNIVECLKESGEVVVNEELEAVYKNWEKKNPFDIGDGWLQPWAQKEMPLTDEVVKNAGKESDKAIVIIGRTAGEQKDSSADKGSYLLSDEEYDMIKKVSDEFSEVCVILNVGNIIDMKWVEELRVGTVMYVWHGGQDGGRAVSDILLGKRYPSGKLSDTIVKDIQDYPDHEAFQGYDEVVYNEDIFVGYRYFETFAKDRVLYPFGFGLGYTEFAVEALPAKVEDGQIRLAFTIKNIGIRKGKEVLQVYCEGIGGKLSRPARELKAFQKTRELIPGESQTIEVSFAIAEMAAYDDTGITGNRACYVLEAGTYRIYAGADVRTATKVLEYVQKDTVVTQKCKSLFALPKSMERIINQDGTVAYERLEAGERNRKAEVPEITTTGDMGIKLEDVYHGKKTMEEFVAQLSDFDLACLSQGEGMNSPKVRPGTGGAIGGLTKSLQNFGIPAICVTDGPSGLRFDNGDAATSLPNGTMISCTWNMELAQELYSYEGMEAYAHNVDALLGPGLNIHKHPLCGRNFEYMSEDPYLAGMMGLAICRGLYEAGVAGTIKHFAANNKELNRGRVNMIISERALREIYLKPFEIVVKNPCGVMIMTAYNRINGVFCSANYDLNTEALRNEWGFEGLVMSDWWPRNCLDEEGNAVAYRPLPVEAQNDLYMVNRAAEESAPEVLDCLERGIITRGELQRNAINILKAILKTPTFERMLEGEELASVENISTEGKELFFVSDTVKPGILTEFTHPEAGNYIVKITYKSDASELKQMHVWIYDNDHRAGVIMVTGTNGAVVCGVERVRIMKGEINLQLEYHQDSIDILKVELFKDNQ